MLERIGVFCLAVALLIDKAGHGDGIVFYGGVLGALFCVFFGVILDIGNAIEPLAVRWLNRRQAQRQRAQRDSGPPMKDVLRATREAMGNDDH